jgi:hypothetical protein
MPFATKAQKRPGDPVIARDRLIGKPESYRGGAETRRTAKGLKFGAHPALNAAGGTSARMSEIES